MSIIKFLRSFDKQITKNFLATISKIRKIPRIPKPIKTPKNQSPSFPISGLGNGANLDTFKKNNLDKLNSLIEDHQEILHYASDILNVKCENLSKILRKVLIESLIKPHYINFCLLDSETDGFQTISKSSSVLSAEETEKTESESQQAGQSETAHPVDQAGPGAEPKIQPQDLQSSPSVSNDSLEVSILLLSHILHIIPDLKFYIFSLINFDILLELFVLKLKEPVLTSSLVLFNFLVEYVFELDASDSAARNSEAHPSKHLKISQEPVALAKTCSDASQNTLPDSEFGEFEDENLEKDHEKPAFDPSKLASYKQKFIDKLLSLIEEAIKVDTIIRDITIINVLNFIRLAHENNILQESDKARLRICLDDLESTLRLYFRKDKENFADIFCQEVLYYKILKQNFFKEEKRKLEAELAAAAAAQAASLAKNNLNPTSNHSKSASISSNSSLPSQTSSTHTSTQNSPHKKVTFSKNLENSNPNTELATTADTRALTSLRNRYKKLDNLLSDANILYNFKATNMNRQVIYIFFEIKDPPREGI